MISIYHYKLKSNFIQFP